MIMGIDPGTLEMTFVVLDDDGKFVCSSELQVRSYLADPIRPGLMDDLAVVMSPLSYLGQPISVCGCEGVYVGSNPRLAVQLGEVVGYIHAACVVAGVPFVEIAPAAGRKALTGNGSAGDRRAIQCACELTGWDAMPVHVADALGVALAARETLGKKKQKEGAE